MGYILIPMSYYGSLTTAMTGQHQGFEIQKMLSSDLREYCKFTSDLYLTYSLENQSTYRALLKIGAGNISSFYDFTGGSYTLRTPLATFGSGNMTIKEYQTVGSYYQHKISAPINSEFNHLCYGILQPLPDSKLRIERDYNFTLPGSSVDINLNGKISYSGFQNNGIKRAGTLTFEYMSSSEKDTLLNIYKLGKGCLPLWWIEDTSNTDTWMQLSLRTMKLIRTIC